MQHIRNIGLGVIKDKENRYKLASYALILLGIALRLYHYFVNRSLWLDEALLSNNIIGRDFAGLLEPLANRQIAPIGFLLVQKLAVIIFGSNEYALRLLPMLCGIASVILFYLLLKRMLPEKLVVLALVFFVFGNNLLYYSHEAKPYSIDLLCYIISMYIFCQKDISADSYYRLIAKGIAGAIMVWFSHIAVLVLGSFCFILIVDKLRTGDLGEIKRLLIPISIWAGSIGLNYFLFLHHNANENIQVSAFNLINYFPPRPFHFSDVSWLYTIVIHLIEQPLGTMSGIFILLFMVLGTYRIIKTRKYRILLMGFPILVHLVLSYFRFYPFYGRFIIYSAAFSIILLVMGFDFIIRWRAQFTYSILLIMVVAFMFQPIKECFKPFYFEEIRPAIAYIEANKAKDDALYVYQAATHSFEFYRSKFNLPNNIVEGEVYNFKAKEFSEELSEIHEKGANSVWLLFTHISHDQERKFINQANKMGKLVDEYKFGGTSSYLVAFSQQAE